MQAIILCGGRGERLMPMTAQTPAALLRIAGRPVIEYLFEQLEKAGFREVTLALGYLSGMIISEYENIDHHGMKITLSSSQHYGTVQALSYAAKEDEDILVLEANRIFDLDLSELKAFHESKHSCATFAVKRQSPNKDSICFSLSDDGRITSVLPSPEAEELEAMNSFGGAYILSKGILKKYDSAVCEDVIKDMLSLLIAENQPVYSYLTEGVCLPVVTPQGFINCQHEMLSKAGGKELHTRGNFAGVSIAEPVYIGKNVTIESGAVIGPYTVIDDNAVIESRCRIDGSYIGRCAHIGSRCEITNSVVSRGATLKASAVCGEYSVCGEGAVIGEGVRLQDGVKIWPGKQVADFSMADTDVKTGAHKPFIINEESSVAISDPSFAARFGMAVASSLEKGSDVLVGSDGSMAAQMISSAFISGLSACGVRSIDVSKSTSRSLMFLISRLGGDVGCYFTSGCAVKAVIMSKGGLQLERQLKHDIENCFERASFRTMNAREYEQACEMSGAAMLYEDFLNSALPDRFDGLNIDVRTGSDITARLAERLFHSRNDIDGERVIFHLSPDGSECSAYSDKTGYVFHERLVLLAMRLAFMKNIPVAVPYVFPTCADEMAEKENGRLYRCYMNSDGVSDLEARKTAARPDNFFVRDAMCLICAIAAGLHQSGEAFSQAVSTLPEFNTVQRYISFSNDVREAVSALDNAETLSCGEGTAVTKGKSRAIIHSLREGGMMIFIESTKAESAGAFCDEIQAKLKKAEHSIENSNN